jgi:NDP-sugar pyrophosphorylase family protein
MVLAAGVGHRLRPLTDQMPKALIEIGGRPLIEIVLCRLARAGVREVIVNVFHHGDRVEGFLRGWSSPGLRIEISRETELLDTGGGLKKAAPFLAGAESFFLHNADVVSAVDLGRLFAAHAASGALATLSVRERAGSRQLLFDGSGQLIGWENTETGERIWAGGPVDPATRLGFDGIQVLRPDIFERMPEEGAFSLTRTYLRLAGRGDPILASRADDTYWADVGSPAKLDAVRKHVAAHGLPV